jgi:hypothetical protein
MGTEIPRSGDVVMCVSGGWWRGSGSDPYNHHKEMSKFVK